jgi:ArsR family metal-binding transcriptional regulator
MLLKKYAVEMVRPTCNASFQSLHCHAHLEEDISEVIPYLNAVLGGTCFVQSPPSVMFKVHGRMISVHSRKISINALKDAEEAVKIVEWLKREINETAAAGGAEAAAENELRAVRPGDLHRFRLAGCARRNGAGCLSRLGR